MNWSRFVGIVARRPLLCSLTLLLTCPGSGLRSQQCTGSKPPAQWVGVRTFSPTVYTIQVNPPRFFQRTQTVFVVLPSNGPVTYFEPGIPYSPPIQPPAWPSAAVRPQRLVSVPTYQAQRCPT